MELPTSLDYFACRKTQVRTIQYGYRKRVTSAQVLSVTRAWEQQE